MEIEIVVLTDGSCLIPLGNSQQNAAFMRLLEGAVDIDELKNFFAVTEESEQILGENLCG